MDAFQTEFEATVAMTIVKKHAAYFEQDIEDYNWCQVNVSCLYHALTFCLHLIR
jgi:hypothetical protein